MRHMMMLPAMGLLMVGMARADERSLLKQLDTNGDGRIQRGEVREHVDQLTSRLDADGDGTLSELELLGAATQLRSMLEGGAKAALETPRFDALRSDIRKNLASLDVDVQKLIPIEEIRKSVDQALALAEREVERVASRLDADGRALRGQAERALAEMPKPAHLLAERLVERLDSDGDHQVSQQEIDEIVGNTFGIADGDADGVLTISEVETALQASIDHAISVATKRMGDLIEDLLGGLSKADRK